MVSWVALTTGMLPNDDWNAQGAADVVKYGGYPSVFLDTIGPPSYLFAAQVTGGIPPGEIIRTLAFVQSSDVNQGLAMAAPIHQYNFLIRP